MNDNNLIREAISIPLTSIPFKNRWGNWVWQNKKDHCPHDMSWPGIKPPTEDAYPIIRNGKWQWELEDK